MKNYKKITFGLVTVLAATTLLAACQKSSKNSDSSEKQKTIVVGTDADTKPFTYSDDGKVTGYDIEVTKAVFEKLPEYKLKIEVTDFNSVMTGLDSGKYQVAANDIGWNEDRAEKYYFSYPISTSTYSVATRPDESVTKLSDLAGQKTEVFPGVNYTQILEDWNKENPNKEIKINYADQVPLATRLGNVESGKFDFLLYDAISLNTVIDEQGFDLKINAIDLESKDEHAGKEYIAFSKDEQGKELKDKYNKALKELEADGTLKELSEKFFKGNYVPTAAEFK